MSDQPETPSGPQYAIHSGYLVELTDECTGGGCGDPYGHEPSCGMIPLGEMEELIRLAQLGAQIEQDQNSPGPTYLDGVKEGLKFAIDIVHSEARWQEELLRRFPDKADLHTYTRDRVLVLDESLKVATASAPTTLPDTVSDSVEDLAELLEEEDEKPMTHGAAEQRVTIAPWTQEEVDALNAFQTSGRMHPFTCPDRDSTDTPHSDDLGDVGVLVATPEGFRCPDCGYGQSWAHLFMLDRPEEP